MSIEDFIIYVYCCVAEEHDSVVGTGRLRHSGYAPKLTDSEAITMELVGEFLSIDTDKGIWQYFRSHWQSWFPKLGSRSNFAKQVSQLCQIKQVILQRITTRLGAFSDTIHLVDGFPIPVCHFARAPRCACFKGEAEYGHCAAKKQTYYGFRGQLLVDSKGVITGITVTAANVDERHSLQDLTDSIHGLLIGDKAYIHLSLKEQLLNQHIDLQTPLRSNMNDSRPQPFVRQLISFRRLIETVIAQLSLRFNIQKVWARDLYHLTNRIVRKLLSHTLAVSFNCSIGYQPLQLESILK